MKNQVMMMVVQLYKQKMDCPPQLVYMSSYTMLGESLQQKLF